MKKLIYEGNIRGAFSGWQGNSIYELNNGSIWKQKYYSYSYQYSYQPKVKVYLENGRNMMEVAGFPNAVEVEKVR